MSFTIQIFEYERLHVGQTYQGQVFTAQHLDLLAQHQAKFGHHFYQIQHRAVQFAQYVGVLQIGKWTIEILPKADKHQVGTVNKWRTVLIELLYECRLLKKHHIHKGKIATTSQRQSLLELYIWQFVEEIEGLLQKGLLRTYTHEQSNQTTMRGRLLLEQQLRYNFAHQERFYTKRAVFTYNHPLNQYLYQAMGVLQTLSLSPSLSLKLQQLIRQFPVLEPSNWTYLQLKSFLQYPESVAYQSVIDLAHLFISSYSPDLRSGQYHLLTMLFDMNKLFEEYIYQSLLRLANKDLLVKRHAIKHFWNRRYVQPDLVVEYKGKTIVLDVKWKVLQRVQPNMNDIRQVFVYNQLFQAQKGILVYPDVYQLGEQPPIPYQTPQGFETSCQLIFVEVVKNGRLNKELDEMLFWFKIL